MIAPNNTPEPDEDGSVAGTSLRARGSRDTRLIERALRQGWNIPEDKRQLIVDRQIKIATSDESSPREATSAARCLATMNQQDTDVAMKLLDKVLPDQHEHNHKAEEMAAALANVREDADYARLRRAAVLGHSRQSGTNGNGGQSGPLANGSAPRPS